MSAAMVPEAPRKSIHQIDLTIGRAKKQRSRIRRHRASIKGRVHAPVNGDKNVLTTFEGCDGNG
jgi:hypothetical protein